MVKTTELRIGNWVEYTLLGKRQIESGADIDGAYEAGAQPIPLTEEWLERMGFEEIRDTVFMSEAGRLTLAAGDKGYYMSDINGQPYSNNQEYVHQLQNLYFALTGEELTIK